MTKPEARFREGFVLHQQERAADAERAYRDVLRQRPKHFDALHMLGVLALQTGRAALGVELISKAIAVNGRNAAAHGNLGNGLLSLQCIADAVASYDKAITLKPDYAEAFYNRGNALAKLDRLPDALASFDKAIALKPDYADAHGNRGNALLLLGRPEAAIASYDVAIALRPHLAEAHYNRGNALRDLRRHDEAVASYDKTIALRPDHADAYCSRGDCLLTLERFEDAITSCDKATALRPDHAEAFYHCGNGLLALKRYEEAVANYDNAIALRPDLAEAFSNRGVALWRLERIEEAVAGFDKAIALKPGYVDAYNNRGNALLSLNRAEAAVANYDQAIALRPGYAEAWFNRGNGLWFQRHHEAALASYDRAIALKPGYAEAYWNQGNCLLQMGRFDPGWRLGEWRKKLDVPVAARSYPPPLWLGEADLAGKTLFIYWEQGFGDTIQFCRYAKLAEQCGAKVIMEVQPALERLLRQLSPTIHVLRAGEDPGGFDYHCPMLSLPLAFGTTVGSIPAEPSYLAAQQGAREYWSTRLPPKTKPMIGVVWSGSTWHANDRRRSIGLTTLLPLLRERAEFVCLQTEIREPDSRILRQLGGVADCRDWLKDFSDTAALVDAMDLVITVDTSVAHLAGAMGKPVWILLPYNSDWRWLLNRDDSPWYPSARLFRQERPGDWSRPLQAMMKALAVLFPEMGRPA